MKTTSAKEATSARAVRNLRFRRNEQRIFEALCAETKKRCNNIQVRKLCRRAHITPQTFYLHFPNSSVARASYENQIITDIDHRISDQAKSEIVFTILISHIVKNQTYFLAANSSHDHFLLIQVIHKYRANLVGNRMSDRPFLNYMGRIVTTISIWLELDELNAQTAQRCVKELLKIRV